MAISGPEGGVDALIRANNAERAAFAARLDGLDAAGIEAAAQEVFPRTGLIDLAIAAAQARTAENGIDSADFALVGFLQNLRMEAQNTPMLAPKGVGEHRLTEQRVSSPGQRGYPASETEVGMPALQQPLVTPSQEKPFGYEPWMGNPWDANSASKNV